MRRARRPSSLLVAALLLPALLFVAYAAPPSAAAQERAPGDTTAQDAKGAQDTLAPADSLEYPRPVVDPRVTLLGDTLSPADTVQPKFSELPEIWPDSLVDPYALDRPGSRPEWVLTGNQLLGRGAQSLLDVMESEALILGDDLGGGGLSVFLGSPVGSHTNVQVVVDGIPANSPLSASWDLRQIPLEAIARVAWYPGPQAAAWGGGATGGVLSITTRRSLASSARSLLAFSVGSFDTETFSGNLGRPITARGDVFVAANFDATDGFEFTGDFTRNQLAVKAGWRFGERHRLEVSRLSDGFSGEASRANISGNQDQDAALLQAFYGGTAGPVSIRAHGYRTRQELPENFVYRDADGLTGDGERRGARADVGVRRGPFVAWGSAAWEHADVSSFHPAFLRFDASNILEPDPDDPTAPLVPNPRRTTEWGGGLGHGEPGGRLAGHVAVRRFDFGDAAEAGTAWQGTAIGRPGSDVTLRAEIGRAVRPADPVGQAVLARFAAQGIEIHPGLAADPAALEKWTAWRGEAAWSREAWRVAATAFGARGEGAFLWLPPSAWLYFDPSDVATVRLGEDGFNTFDVVDLSARGFEAQVDLALPWDLRGRIGVRRLELVEDSSDEQIPYAPRTQALGQIRWAGRFFPSRDLLIEARLTGRYSGERATLGGGILSDYLIGDALVQATIINFTVFVSFKNIAGQAVLAEEAFALPEREGYLGVNWRFRN